LFFAFLSYFFTILLSESLLSVCTFIVDIEITGEKVLDEVLGLLMLPAFSLSVRVPVLGLVVLDEFDVGTLAGHLRVFVNWVNFDAGVAVHFAPLGKLETFGGTPEAHEGGGGLFEELDLAFPGFLDGRLVGPSVDVAAGGSLVDAVQQADGGDAALGAELFALGGPYIVIADVVGSREPLQFSKVCLEGRQLGFEKEIFFFSAVADVQDVGSVENGREDALDHVPGGALLHDGDDGLAVEIGEQETLAEGRGLAGDPGEQLGLREDVRGQEAAGDEAGI